MVDTCDALYRNSQLAKKFDPGRFERLHPDGQRLISDWLKRASAMLDCDPDESFDPFIFTWISFNGWAYCVTDLDHRERDWIDALILNNILYKEFEKFVKSNSNGFGDIVNEFSSYWPIFEARAIRRKVVKNEMHPISGDNRSEIVDYYLQHGIPHEPSCFKSHTESGEQIPIDWPHTLVSIYRVRNNLFHGEKSSSSEMNALIVHSSFRTLCNFLVNSGYILGEMEI